MSCVTTASTTPPAERQRIGRLEGDCARYMVRGAKDGVINSVFGLGSELQGILDAIGGKSRE